MNGSLRRTQPGGKRRKLAGRILAALLAGAMCLTGCGSAESASGAEEFVPQLDTQEEVTLNIIGNLENFEALEAVITDFNEYYPNVDVEYSCMEDYKDTIEARLRGDTSVGIFQIFTGIYDNEYIAESCADLADEIDMGDIQDNVVSSVTVDGKRYCLPLALNTSGLAVNVTLLEKYGLSVPTDYQELLDCCETLKENGYSPIQGFSVYGMFSNLIKSKLYCTIFGSDGSGSETITDMVNAEDGCTEIVRDSYTMLRELLDKGYIDLALCDSYEDNYNYVIMSFFDGDVPFMEMTSETFSGTKKRESKSEYFSENPFEYTFICTPTGEDDGYSYIENWTGFAVNENCPEKEWAMEFMRFLATKDEINLLASTKNMPSVAKESDDDRFEGIYTENSENTVYSAEYVPSAVSLAIERGARSLAADNNTVDEALDVMLENLKNPEE